jgi:DNA-binding MarR family transcriptional regulator
MVGMATPEQRDSIDDHVARWARFWKDNPAYAGEVEGALVRMGHILRYGRRQDAAAFAGSDFTLEDYKTLHVLMVQPYPAEATPAQLAEYSGVTRAAITSRLDRLVAAGLVTRSVDESDRRRVLVRPTPAGRELWDHHIYEGMAREQKLLQVLSLDELTQLNALLRKVVLSIEG